MKTFLRVIWTIIKVILMTCGFIALCFVLLLVAVALLAPRGRAHVIQDKSVLVFNLNTRITDHPVDKDSVALARLLQQDENVLQLRAATEALHRAATDTRISGLYLQGTLSTVGNASGYGALKELREAIASFQKSGKPVIAYIENGDNRDYYLESVADQILLNPTGIIALRGLAAEGTFFKDAGDKYGVEFTAIRHGRYKSAIEPFTRDDFSPENREQLDALLKTIWGDMVDTIAASRKISPAQLQSLVDQEALISAESARDHGLVTELAFQGQTLDKLRKLTGETDKKKAFPQVSLSEYAAQTAHSEIFLPASKDKIAVLYAEGTIIDGSGSRNGENQVAGDHFARLVRQLRERSDVKALVLRVNSPGGSAQASENILAELQKFNADRPVIVSMGTMAASGGYFISMASRRIVAEPTTITGSIGVFGLSLNAQKLANDHGITFDTVKTGELADIGTIARPMTPKEEAVFQGHVDHIYDKFIQHVADCRKMTTNHVDEIAQGRVWSGADALKVGLVDEFGGLQKAIDIAAKDAKTGTNYAVVEYPKPRTLEEQISDALHGNRQPLEQAGLASRVMQTVEEELRWLSSFDDPQNIYARLPFDLQLN